MKHNTIRWGILGTANIAQTQLIPAIQQSNNGALHAIAGRSAEKTARFAALFQPAKTYAGYEALLHDPEVDAVYIPLSNKLHFEWVTRALRAKKHVLCEKPIGLTAAEVRDMQQTARENGVLLTEAMAYLHSPYMARLREIVQQGGIGTPLWAAAWFSNSLQDVERGGYRLQPEAGSGSLYDLGCYSLSLLRYVYGQEPTGFHATGKLTPDGVETTASATLAFPGPFTASLFSSFESPLSAGYRFVGTEGSVEGVGFMFNKQGGVALKLARGQSETVETIECPNNYRLEVEQFGRAVLDGEPLLIPERFIEDNIGLLDRMHREIVQEPGR